MGEYADMILDGFVDQYTGEVIDGDSPGYPRTKPRSRPKKKKAPAAAGERCPKCGKRCKSAQGVADHVRDVHGVKS